MIAKPRVAQFCIADGVAQEYGPFTGVSHSARSPSSPAIYILTEATTPYDGEACYRAVETIERVFHRQRLSLTSRAITAIKAAHEELRAENAKSLPEHHIGLGVTCAVWREEELYLAQAGPSLAHLFGKQGLQCLCPAEGSHPLGIAEDLDIRLSRILPLEGRIPVAEGDSLLLSSSSLSRLTSAERLRAILLQEGQGEALRELYILASGEKSFAALLLTFSSDDTSLAPTSVGAWLPAGKRRRATPSWASYLRRLLSAVKDKALPGLAKGSTKAKSWLLKLLRLFLPILGAFIVLLLLVIGAFYLPRYMAKQSEARFAQMVVQAKDLRTQALATADRDLSRRQLTEAGRLIDAALNIKRSEQRALSLKQRVESDLAKINAAFELSNVKPLVDFQRQTTHIGGIIVNQEKLYLHDAGNGSIYEYPLDKETAAPKVLLERGLVVGDQPAGKAVRMLWMPGGGLRSGGEILILDDSRALIGYSPAEGLHRLVVRGSQEWDSLTAAAGFNGNLYILDAKANQVWRYLPTDNGYDSERKGILVLPWKDANLPEALDMAVDGSVYILTASGDILRFASGEGQSLSKEGIDRPLSNPVGLFCTANTRSLYVADAGNKRIVVLSKEGRFQRQLVGVPLSSLQAIFVDEGKGRIYIVSDNRLYVAPLPK